MTAYDEHDPTARVSRHEIEVAATPEQVWTAIATGPGIATWFVPAEVEEREGGAIVTHHGPYGASEGVVTAWEPPHRFAYEERGWNPDAPDAPPWATELLVEARGGGTCVVRLVSGFFHDGEGWEDQLEGTDEGWATAMVNLREYLTHFSGLTASHMSCFGSVPAELDAAREALMGALGLDGVKVGDHVQLPDGAPPVEGVVAATEPHGVLLRTQAPWPGLLGIGVYPHDGVTVMLQGYLYGEGGEAVAEREGARWAAWLAEHVDGFTEVR